MFMRRRPLKVGRQLFTDGDKHDAGAKLRNAIIRSVQQPPIRLVAKLGDLAGNIMAVIIKDGIENAAHVLDHNSARADLVNQAECRREHIALIGLAKLLAGFGEGRAGQAAGQKINPFEGGAVEGL